MSIYSGFATRPQESFYNKVLERAIQLLSYRLIQTIKRLDEALENKTSPLSQRGMDDTKWFMHFKKIFQALHKAEKTKYLDPKFGPSMYPLMKFLLTKHGGSKNPSMVSMNMSQNSNYPFNDTQSLSSFYSNDTQHKRLINDQKLNKLNLTAINSLPNGPFSMQEKSLEEEEDKIEEAKHLLQKDSKPVKQRNSEFSSAENSIINNRSHYSTIEPQLKNKLSNRTISVNSQLRNYTNKTDDQFNDMYVDLNHQRHLKNMTPMKNMPRKAHNRNQRLDIAYKTVFPTNLQANNYMNRRKFSTKVPEALTQNLPTQRQTQNNSRLTGYGYNQYEQSEGMNSSVDNGAPQYNSFLSSDSNYQFQQSPEKRPYRTNSEQVYGHNQGALLQLNFTQQKQKKKVKNKYKFNIVYNAPQLNMKFVPSQGMKRKYVMNLNELVKIHNEFNANT